MGLQKYRADIAGEPQSDGAVCWSTRWIGGPTLALIRNCVCENRPEVTPRTVYIIGEYLTFSSLPAACKFKGKTLRGVVTVADNNDEILVFRAYPDKDSSND